MNKEDIEAIIKEYESDKENLVFCTIVMTNGQKYGQLALSETRFPIKQFNLLSDETLKVDFGVGPMFISINDISEIHLRSNLLNKKSSHKL